MRLVWSLRSENDLAAIVNYIAADNLDAALELDCRITSFAESLLDFPKRGKPGRVAGTRELTVHEHYVLVYETEGEDLRILSVLHTSRQWPPK